MGISEERHLVSSQPGGPVQQITLLLVAGMGTWPVLVVLLPSHQAHTQLPALAARLLRCHKHAPPTCWLLPCCEVGCCSTLHPGMHSHAPDVWLAACNAVPCLYQPKLLRPAPVTTGNLPQHQRPSSADSVWHPVLLPAAPRPSTVSCRRMHVCRTSRRGTTLPHHVPARPRRHSLPLRPRLSLPPCPRCLTPPATRARRGASQSWGCRDAATASPVSACHCAVRCAVHRAVRCAVLCVLLCME
jgi:hypothetical protein